MLSGGLYLQGNVITPMIARGAEASGVQRTFSSDFGNAGA